MRLLFALITLAAPFSFAQSTVLQIDPACPVYGAEDYGTKEITLTYNTRNPSATLKTPQKPILDIVVNGPFRANNTRTASFSAQPDGSWHATVKHANGDYWAYMIFPVRDEASGQIDHNSGHYWGSRLLQQGRRLERRRRRSAGRKLHWDFLRQWDVSRSRLRSRPRHPRGLHAHGGQRALFTAVRCLGSESPTRRRRPSGLEN